MQNFNYHTHTYRCKHSDPSISDEEYVTKLIDKGFKKIAFTDHCPHKEIIDPRGNMRMDYSQKEEYYSSVESLKHKYKDLIEIEVGFEVEYLPGLEDYLKELKEETDKIILGQHFVYDEDGEHLKIISHVMFDDSDVIKYAKYIEKAMECKIPDIVAHPDFVMLSRDAFGEADKEAANIICKAAEKYQIPLEINLTRAVLYLSNKIKEIDYPCRDFWEIASKYNIKVVYGVDAHFRNQIDLYEDSVELVNDFIGKEIINKLNFCEKNL